MIRVSTAADLAEVLGMVRRLRKLSQRQVAERLGTTPSRIGEYERCRRVTNVRTALKILDALGYELAVVPKAVAITTDPD